MNERVGQCDNLLEAVARFIDARELIRPSEGVVVGVSGGADSVALLDVLRKLSGRDDRNWRLTVAHVHHGLREAADADERFVADLSAAWNLPFVSVRRDVAAEARRTGGGVEEVGRAIRYDFLRDVAVEAGAACVAVGHHADDNVETILHRIFRGTHLRGAAGIAACRELSGSRVRLIRPLLSSRREQIERYCRGADLNWRTDETNADVRYRRNFIRHELLPLLRRRVNPRADEALLRLARAAGEAEEYLTAEALSVLQEARRQRAPRHLELDLATIARRPDILRRYVIREALAGMHLPFRKMSEVRLAELSAMFEASGPSGVALPGGFVARRLSGRIIISPPQGPVEVDGETVSLACPGCTDLGGGRRIVCEILTFDQPAFDEHCRANRPGVELLDADEVRGPLVCRPRRRGEKFHPLGCAGRQSVGDFLSNLKVRRAGRAQVRCICDDAGIVYLAPLRIDERAKITCRTRRMLRITAGGFL